MKMKILDLRPTQMVVGMKEVDFRIQKIRSLKSGEVHDYLEGHRIPVVLGPRERVYLIDHHHLVRAGWEAGLEEVPVEVHADHSNVSIPRLWEILEAEHWLHTYDQFGQGPHDPIHLPENVRSFADDPFRSLAWAVKERGGFVKTDIPFAEFQWAQFYRKNMKLHPVFDHFDQAVKEAIELSKGPAASGLPGYLGKGA
jgi:hypothetical protein